MQSYAHSMIRANGDISISIKMKNPIVKIKFDMTELAIKKAPAERNAIATIILCICEEHKANTKY